MGRVWAALFFSMSLTVHAQSESVTVTTAWVETPDLAKGVELRPRVNELAMLVKSGKFADADALAAELRIAYESTFDNTLKQYTFQSKSEYDEFRSTPVARFEWVDWGYKQCVQTQAFLAAQRRDFAHALVILREVEVLAPVSAGTLVETGYIFNQLGSSEDALIAYRRAHDLSVRYVSQSSYRAVALRGIGFALIDLKQLDQAETMFRESLELEPDSKIARSELEYIEATRRGQ